MNKNLFEILGRWFQENQGSTKPEKYNYAQKNILREKAEELRSILGDIMFSVNQASSIFKSASRSPSPENSAAVREILDEVENYPRIRQLLQSIKPLFSQEGPFGGESNSRMILHSIHYLERARFTDQQKERLRELAQLSYNNSSDFPDEVNQAGLDNLLRNSIYNLSGGSQKTLKVLREILQNAVDATDPKQHPELLSRQDFSPEIHIDSELFRKRVGDETKYFIDLVVEDRGVGMDWETLSKKFFVTFDSGKSADTGAAGGFGIAKALIQDAPEHGWSVDTGGIHSSRFNKNVFFGTRRGTQYEPPSSEIRKNRDGTTLSLHGLPFTSDENIKNLCSVYATNGRVKIFFKGEEQKPKFTMESEDIKPMDNVDELPEIMSDDESEKDAVGRVFSKFREDLREKLEDVGLSSNNKTKYKFFLKKTQSSGKLYVMVNGQYQFDKEKYIPKIDIICSVETTARPGDDDYPLDPGREYLRGDISKRIDELVSILNQFSSKVAEDDLFKDGIEMINVNEEAEPMVVSDSDSKTSKEDMMLFALQGVAGDSGFDKSEEPDERVSDSGRSYGTDGDSGYDGEYGAESGKGSDGGRDTYGSAEDKEDEKGVESSEEANIEKVTNDLFNLAGGKDSVFSKEVIKGMVQDAVSEKDNRVEMNRKIRAIIEGLSTPGQILIQKNFIARQALQENPKMLGEIMIVWQKAMRLIMQKVASTTRYSFSRGREFVPGVVFSNEVLGLYMPAKKDAGRMYDSVSINPVTLSAHILPKDFQEKVAEDGFEKEAFDLVEQSEKSSSSDTPINRVSKFIFHLAVHEMCHLIYPDFKDTGSEEFHRNISKMEMICHDVYEEIRKEVKTRMKGLRKSAKSIISLVGKHKPSRIKEWFVGFKKWSCSKKESSEMKYPVLSEHKHNKINTFREFLESY